MDKNAINSASCDITELRNKIGETVWDFINEDDNSTYEIGKCVMAVFANCSSKKEFEAANNMLSAICGYNFESIVEEIKQRDSKCYIWASLCEEE